MPQSNPRIHSASSFATSHCETSNNDVPIFLGNEQNMTDELNEFITRYVEILAAFRELELVEHATPENVRGITVYLLSKKGKTSDKTILSEELKNAGNPWTPQLDQELQEDYAKDQNLKNLAAKYHRTTGAIRSRLEKLGVIRF